MNKLIAVINQKGTGCDYTIHCGTLVLYQGTNKSDNSFIKRVIEYKGDTVTKFFKVKEVDVSPTGWEVIE